MYRPCTRVIKLPCADPRLQGLYTGVHTCVAHHRVQGLHTGRAHACAHGSAHGSCTHGSCTHVCARCCTHVFFFFCSRWEINQLTISCCPPGGGGQSIVTVNSFHWMTQVRSRSTAGEGVPSNAIFIHDTKSVFLTCYVEGFCIIVSVLSSFLIKNS